MNINTIMALVFKETKQIKRDISSILVAFVLPLIILLIYGYGVSFNIENIRIDLVLNDSSKISRDLAETYVNSKYFKTNVVYSFDDAKNNMESGKTMGIITIPENFSANLKNGAKIQIISDGTDPNTASYIEAYATGLSKKFLMAAGLDDKSQIDVFDRIWFNPTTESINFLMAGALTMILAIVGTFLTALVVAKEWERGTMEALIATTVSVEEIIISKVIPYFGLSILSLIFTMTYGVYIFNMPFEGSILALSLISGIFISVSLLMGLLISTSAKDQFIAAMGSILVTFLPTMMLSGFVFEISSMPLWLRVFTTFFPARYFVSSIRTIILVGDVWEIIIRDSVVLFLMGWVLFFLLRRKMKKDVE